MGLHIVLMIQNRSILQLSSIGFQAQPMRKLQHFVVHENFHLLQPPQY
jgi:hypothetical protein